MPCTSRGVVCCYGFREHFLAGSPAVWGAHFFRGTAISSAMNARALMASSRACEPSCVRATMGMINCMPIQTHAQPTMQNHTLLMEHYPTALKDLAFPL